MGPFRAMDVNECAGTRLGLTQSQRIEHLRRAVERGDQRRLEALLVAGADVEHRDEYGHTPLFLAAWRGHAHVAECLLHWGADAAACSNSGTSALAAACACKHASVAKLLQQAASEAQQREVCQLRPPLHSEAGVLDVATGSTIATLASAEHGVAWYVDGAFSEAFLQQLEALFRSLPVAPKEDREEAGRDGQSAANRKRIGPRMHRPDRSRQEAAPRRHYFCDVDGWVVEALAQALARSYPAAAQTHSSRLLLGDRPGAGSEVRAGLQMPFSQMRFLNYAEVGGYLAPHQDLARTDAVTGRKSTHTFLLYLDGAAGPDAVGGETVLLEGLELASPTVAAVAPVRGRLFAFPHAWPHKAMPVEKPPKLLLRGEMC